ncbi:TolC family protein [Segetibacter koreensis]|uniref:TolC family protein n=1 Tax=Segetibacter koreensis TaxID=398037 RepID=UPI00036BC4E5|nr:TolC family protein [Segetibacter koreensis]
MRVIVCLFILLGTIRVYGQRNTISIPDLLQKISQDYPSIKAKEASVKAASYRLQSARKDYLPELTAADQYQYSTNNGLEGSYFSNEGTAISTSGGVRDQNIYNPVFGSFTTLMVNWHAFNFGKVKQSVQFANSQVQVAKADYNNEVFQLQVRAIDVYLLLALSEKLVSVQQANLERAKVFQTYVQSHTQAGLLPGLDSSASNAEVARAGLALLQSKQLVEEQKIQLSQLSNISVDSLNVDTTTFLTRVPLAISGDSAINNNPVINLYKQMLQNQVDRSLVIKKSALPTINILGMGWARGSGINKSSKKYSSDAMSGIPYQTYNYMAAVAVKCNILSLAKEREEYKAAEQDIESSRYRLDEQTLRLQKQMKNANLQYQYALQQTRLAPVQYKAALEAYNLSNARYQAGLAPLTELIQAFTVLNRASVDVTVANNNVWRSLLQKAASSGMIADFVNQVPK